MGARARLQLREQMADVRLDGLFGEKQALTDLAVHEAVGDQLQNLDLTHGRLLLELAERSLERDYLGARGRSPACRDLLEPPRMIRVPGHDLFALSSVHGLGIGGYGYPL